ncbi:MAG: flavodoxin family protein [Pseudobdellovibrionaceae bacterium]
MSDVVVVFHSGYGHTEVVAKAIAKGAGADLVKVNAQGTIGDADWAKLALAKAIIFGAPTYMGSLSAPFKTFMDASSKVWFTQGWKDKIAAGFTNSGSMSGDKLSSLVQLAVFAAQQGMIWVGQSEANESSAAGVSSGDPESVNRIGSYLGLMAQSDNVAPDQTPPQGDIKTAELFGKRVADMAKRFV